MGPNVKFLFAAVICAALVWPQFARAGAKAAAMDCDEAKMALVSVEKAYMAKRRSCAETEALATDVDRLMTIEKYLGDLIEDPALKASGKDPKEEWKARAKDFLEAKLEAASAKRKEAEDKLEGPRVNCPMGEPEEELVRAFDDAKRVACDACKEPQVEGEFSTFECRVSIRK